MTDKQISLRQKIESFQIDDFDSSFSFSDRLSRENGWKYEYTLRVINEYKKFMFLICIADFPLTPSDQVDQVWHLHMIYTKSYWTRFCKETIGREIHHGPTKGGRSEKTKYNDWYAKTKDFYFEIFNKKVPIDIWPSSKIRFGEINFRRVNTHQNWIIPKLLKK